MSKFRRKQYFVDIAVQGSLTVRVMAYWLYCLLAVFVMIGCWTLVSDRPESSSEFLARVWQHGGPAVIASLLMLPIVLLDCIRMSNRFAGPIYRLRRATRELIAGVPIEPVTLRKGDFWVDYANDFNRLLAYVRLLEAEVAKYEAKGAATSEAQKSESAKVTTAQPVLSESNAL